MDMRQKTLIQKTNVKFEQNFRIRFFGKKLSNSFQSASVIWLLDVINDSIAEEKNQFLFFDKNKLELERKMLQNYS